MPTRAPILTASVALLLSLGCQGPQTPPGPNAGTAVPSSGTQPSPDAPKTTAKAEPVKPPVKVSTTTPATTQAAGAVTLKLKVRADGGVTIPARSRLVVFWVVSSGSPDYVYKFGDGVATPSGAQITFARRPPVEALNSYGPDQLGVALIVAVPESLPALPDGRMTDRELFRKYYRTDRLGMVADHGLIWRAGAFSDARYNGRFEWPRAFKQSEVVCAVGERKPEGVSGFDTFKPAPCEDLVVIFGGKDDWINWT